MRFEWTYVRHNRGYYPVVFFLSPEGKVFFHDGQFHNFDESVLTMDRIPGPRNGKWTPVIFIFSCPDTFKVSSVLPDWDSGRLFQGSTWEESIEWFEKTLGGAVDVRSYKSAVMELSHPTWSRLTDVDSMREKIESESGAALETQAISYGSPTLRQERDGFWSYPIIVTMPDGSEAEVLDFECGHPSTDSRVKVIRRVHSPGYHGGHYTVVLCVPAGSAISRRVY